MHNEYQGPGMTEYSGYKWQKGVTLLELMIVVVIIAIITAFAYPSYTQFILRAKRTAGTSMLLQIADRQQQFFMDNKQFAANLTRLGYPANTVMIDEEGAVVADASIDRIYNINVSASTATTYTLTAAPQLVQASKDTKCGSLTLSNAGAKGYSGSGDHCW
jgi:type IV pilus assembly protein PilE